MLKKIILASLCCTALTSSLANAEELTLNDAVEIGIYTNPEYGVVANNRQATAEELRQADGLFLPSIDLNGDAGYEYTDDPNTRGGVGDDTESLFRNDVGITLTQLLFDGWGTQNEIQRQKNRVRSASHRVNETAEFVGLDIVEAFLDVIRRRELLIIARNNVDAHVNIVNQIADGAQAGRSTQADVSQAEARLAQAQALEADRREQLRNAEAFFKREVGKNPEDLIVPTTPVNLLSVNVDEEVDKAFIGSPTLDVFESDIAVAMSEREAAKATFYPELNAQLNARTGNDIGGIEGEDTSATALVTMDWNLYRGGIDTARVKEFTYRHAEAKERRADAARTLEEDVRNSWASMVAAGERSKRFAEQARANEMVVKAYQDQFELDRRTLLDVLDAQNELFVSRSSAIDSEFVEMLAVYRLLALRGELLDVLSVNRPPETVIDEEVKTAQN